MSSRDVFRRIIAALDGAEIHHMLTGSFASSYHGSPRATKRKCQLAKPPSGGGGWRHIRTRLAVAMLEDQPSVAVECVYPAHAHHVPDPAGHRYLRPRVVPAFCDELLGSRVCRSIHRVQIAAARRDHHRLATAERCAPE